MVLDLPWELDLFAPEDALGVVALYRSIYGENYPVKTIYDPAALIRQDETGEAWRAVGRDADGRVAGHVSFYRSSPPNPGLYEFGQLMVRHDYRQTNLAVELMTYALEAIPHRHQLEHIWGEAVCNHLFTQMSVSREGFAATGLEAGLMPGESYRQAFSDPSPDRERVSALLVFRCFQPRPQFLYLPQVYAEMLRWIYEATESGHAFLPSKAPLPEGVASQASLQLFEGAGVARMTFDRLGEDFEVRLTELESQASVGGAEVTQVLFRLTEPCTDAVVQILRQRGYFFGGALPRWFDDDGLLMQKVRVDIDFAKIHVYTKPAKRIKEFIRLDRESVRLRTAGEMLMRAAKRWPEKTALVHLQRNVRYSYAELDSEADKVARALMALGVAKGEHVAVWSFNAPEYQLVEFGCARAGAPIVTINGNYRAFELEYVLRQSDTVVLFFSEGTGQAGEHSEILRGIRGALPALRHAVLLEEVAAADELSWTAFLDKAAEVDSSVLQSRSSTVSSDDIFAIHYTSGTTGNPKGVMHRHSSYLLNADLYAERQCLSCKDTVCMPLPFFHVYGNIVSLAAFLTGGTVAVLERFRAADMLGVIETCRATTVSGTPTMFVAALAELANHSYDLSSLRKGDMGGASCPPDLVRAVAERMGAQGLGILYGSTECFCVCLHSPLTSLEQRMSHAGTPLPTYEMKVVSAENGEIKDKKSPGELYIRGVAQMTQYYKDKAGTDAAVDAEGWWRSGDLGYVDERGYCHITGRIKDLIIRGGENIYPAEVETYLAAHSKVLDAQVVGIPCEYYGEDCVAFIRLQPGQSADVLEMKRYCREKLALHKVPAMFFFVDEYPLTASGKVQKYKLREMAVQRMAESQ